MFKILKKLILLIMGFLFNFSSVLSLEIFNRSEIKLVSSESYDIPRGCQEVDVPINFKKLILNLESNHIDRVLITDKRISECSEEREISKCCNKNSTFCIENVNPTQNEFKLNYCIDYTYLYACVYHKSDLNITNNMRNLQDLPSSSQPVEYNNDDMIDINNLVNKTEEIKNQEINNTALNELFVPGSITLKTSVIRGQGCQTTEYLSDTECSSFGLNSCKDKKKCSAICSYVECRKDYKDANSKVFSMCLPSKLADSEVINRCKNHVAFYEPSMVTPQIFRVNCDKKDENGGDSVQKVGSHSFFKFLLVIFGVFLLSTFIASVYYRFKLSFDQIPPFEPPSFVPNFIFPRQFNY
jgi:hypothetical protein